nr:hypothetical protein [Bacteroides intestinalis]
MSDSVSRRYNQVLEDLNLDGYPMSDYDELDMVSLMVDLEKAFDIQIDDDKADELFRQGSHEAWIEYIKSLL